MLNTARLLLQYHWSRVASSRAKDALMSDWRLVYSDAAGEVHEHPTLGPLGGTFGATRALGRLIPLPDGATLCMVPRCAAQCVGCISEQDGPVPSPQVRLDFAPTPDEITDVAVRHLLSGGTMVSFGQGCEGDPLNCARALAGAIRLIRARTDRGLINMNPNGWNYRGLEEMCKAGLNRIRVSLFSAHPAGYDGYYRPRGYGLAQVEASMHVARRYGLTVALNLLVFPGYTDCDGETAALIDLLTRTGAHEVQLRTLNIDREMLAEAVPPPLGPERGIAHFVATMRRRLPHVRLATHSNPDGSSP